jgi:hypothetical protein
MLSWLRGINYDGERAFIMVISDFQNQNCVSGTLHATKCLRNDGTYYSGLSKGKQVIAKFGP